MEPYAIIDEKGRLVSVTEREHNTNLLKSIYVDRNRAHQLVDKIDIEASVECDVPLVDIVLTA